MIMGDKTFEFYCPLCGENVAVVQAHYDKEDDDIVFVAICTHCEDDFKFPLKEIKIMLLDYGRSQ